MPTIDGLDPTLQWALTTLFVVAVGIFSAWSHVFGNRPARPEAKEFSFSGQLTDVEPVRNLVEQAGLLVQQQVRTNVVLEAHTKKLGQTAIGLQGLTRQIGRLADAYEQKVRDEEQDEEVERKATEKAKEMADRMVEERLAEEGRRRPGRT